MFDTIRRVSIHTDLSGRLVATVIGTTALGDEMTAEYRTSPRLEGLWEWDDNRKDWRQILGTCQYYARDAAQMRRKIRRMLAPA